MHLRQEGAATILDQDDVEAAVGGVRDGGVNATGGNDPGDDQGGDAKVAQDVLDIGGAEDGAGGLVEDELIAGRSQLGQDVGIGRPWRRDVTELFVRWPAIAPVGRHRGDADVDDLEPCAPESVLQTADIGHDDVHPLANTPAPPLPSPAACNFRIVAPSG